VPLLKKTLCSHPTLVTSLLNALGGTDYTSHSHWLQLVADALPFIHGQTHTPRLIAAVLGEVCSRIDDLTRSLDQRTGDV